MYEEKTAIRCNWDKRWDGNGVVVPEVREVFDAILPHLWEEFDANCGLARPHILDFPDRCAVREQLMAEHLGLESRHEIKTRKIKI